MRLAAFLSRQALSSTLRSPTVTEKPPSNPIRTAPDCLACPSAIKVFAPTLMHSLLRRSSTTQDRPRPARKLPCLSFHTRSQWACNNGLLPSDCPRACVFLRREKIDELLSSCGRCC